MNLLIQSFKKKMTLRVRIRDEKTSWRWRLSFTIVNVFFHAKNHASFMREMLVLRITDREDDHFDRFGIHVEFFVWFFLKFIENDHLSWMKNAVNRKWWMRKWVVKKTKMRHKWVFSLKKDFFFFVFNQASLSLCLRILLFSLFVSKFFFEASVMSFMWNSSSADLNVIKFDRLLSKSLKIVLDKNSRSRCYQKCIKFLIENFIFKCVFDVSRVVCNRCERLNAACMTIKMSWICRWRVDDWSLQIDFAFYVASRQVLEQISIVVIFAQNDVRRVAWMRKMLFLRKLMKQRERERSNEKKNLFVIRRQFDRLATFMKILEDIARWIVNVLTCFDRRR